MVAKTVAGLVVAGALLAGAALASEDVYRWVDERGARSYGNKPPPGARNVAKLSLDAGNVSVIPGPPLRTARAQSTAPLPADPVASSVDRTTVGDLERFIHWRERCFAERRVDCADPSVATYDHAPSFVPRVR
jgi:hypothetical protein